MEPSGPLRPCKGITLLLLRAFDWVGYVTTTNETTKISNCQFPERIIPHEIYRVSQEEYARLRESVPYVKVYRYNPKHLYPKLNGYGDSGQRRVGASCGSKYCNLHS